MPIKDKARSCCLSSELSLMKPIICLIHSTAAISADANKIKPKILIRKDHLYLHE